MWEREGNKNKNKHGVTLVNSCRYPICSFSRETLDLMASQLGWLVPPPLATSCQWLAHVGYKRPASLTQEETNCAVSFILLSSLWDQVEADLHLRRHPCLAFFFPPPCSASLLLFLLGASLSKSLAQESPFQRQSGFPRNKDRYLGCQPISAFRLHKIWSCCVFYSRILHNLFFKNNNPSLIEIVWGL